MATKKQQHYVPKLYMKNFANDKLFNLYHHESKKFLYNIPYSEQCKENYYYGIDLKWENKLGEVEAQYSKIIYKIKNDSSYFPNNEEINIIKEFIIFQKLRVKFKEKESKKMRWALKESIAKIVAIKKMNIVPTDEILSKLREMNYDTDTLEVIKTNLEIATDLPKNIKDLKLCILNYSTVSKLISSDNPVIHYNKFRYCDVGLGLAGLLIIFPITPEKIIVIYDSKMYNLCTKIYNINNEGEVKKLNAMQYIVSDRIIYFKNKDTSKELQKIIIKYKKTRYEYQNRKNEAEFGTDTNKVIVHQENFINNDFSLSFAKVNDRANGFDNVVKDWIPRKKSDEYIKRLSSRRSMFLNNVFENITKKHKKEIIEFEKFVYCYWENNL